MTTALIIQYVIASQKRTPKLSGFLKNNCQSPVYTTHNEAQHRVYTEKRVTNNVQLRDQNLNKIPGLGT